MSSDKSLHQSIIFNEEFNRSVLDAISANIAVLDSHGQIITVNNAWNVFARQNGIASERVSAGVNYLDVCRKAEKGGDSSARDARLGIESVIKREMAQFTYEYPCHSKSEQRWFLLKVTPISQQAGVVVLHENITSRRVTENLLHESHTMLEERVKTRTAELQRINKKLLQEIEAHAQAERGLRQAATVYENALEAIMVVDSKQNIISVNTAFTNMTGYSYQEAIGLSAAILESPRLSTNFLDEFWAKLHHRGSWQGEMWHQRKNGEQYPVLKSVSTVRDDRGNVQNYICVFSDISELKIAEERLSELAHHDQLTGLANRLLFTARLEQAIQRAERRNEKLAILYLDLDHFKNINDTLGHATGDKLLISIGQRLKKLVRKEDTVARLGGDEFIILLEDIQDPQLAAQLATKICDKLAKEARIDDVFLAASASIGISIYPVDATGLSDLLRCADLAMYSAKELGRNTYRFYHAKLTDIALERFSIEKDLRKAMQNNELVVLYQPQFNPKNRELFGVEVLVRWDHPVHGRILPDRFIRIAEETGLIHELDEWVMRTALFQIKEWQRQDLFLPRVAINISVRELLHDHLIKRVNKALADSEIDLTKINIELEVTETVLQRSKGHAKTLSELRKIGIRVSIDDFGTGYSSLSQLKKMPVDAVKIDRSFLSDIHTDEDSQAIVIAIISMAHSLGLQVIAEGIENQSQLEFLQKNNCNAVQGFLLSKPLVNTSMTEYLKRAN